MGAAVFSIVDYVIDEYWGSDTGAGILTAVTLDGIPENLALGVALIGASVGEVSALAAAIVLSNLPEAAGGSADLVASGWSAKATVALWSIAAVLLSTATFAGHHTATGQIRVLAKICQASALLAASDNTMYTVSPKR